jgi:iron complex outermembrane recepter protein
MRKFFVEEDKVGKKTVWNVAALGCVIWPSMVMAQEAADEKDNAGEIVVTAQRREQRLSDVPIAVTAFDQDGLEKRQINGAADLQKVVPNLSYTATNFGGSNFSIRGIGRTVIGDGADSGVGFHFNGAFLQNGGNSNLFYDIDTVEVLRGPQGTLFGRNATGGVINIRTHKPDFKSSGYVDLGIGLDNRIFAEGGVSAPISDTLALRIAGLSVKSRGDIRELTSGQWLNGDALFSARGSLRWQPSDRTTVDLVVNYLHSDTRSLQAEQRACKRDPIGNLGCLPDALGSDHPNSLATFPGLFTKAIGLTSDVYDPLEGARNPSKRGEVALDFLPRVFTREVTATLEIEHEFTDALKLNTITAYASDTGFYETDPDFAVGNSYLPVPGLFPDGAVPVSAPDPGNSGSLDGNILGVFNRPYAFERGSGKGHQWLQEVRLASNFETRLNFLIGGFFLDYKRAEDFFSIHNGYDAVALATGNRTPFLRIETPKADLTSYAGFGELYFKPADTVTLTGGLRWTRDKKTQVNRSTLLAGIPAFSNNTSTNDALTGRFVVEWKPEISAGRNLNLYASYARGYKGGGFNPQGQVAVPLTFKPESIDAIEAGAKFASGTISANLAAFHYDYRDLQISKIVNQTSVNENIDAKIWGVEFEASAKFQGFAIDGALSYLHSAIGGTSSIDPRDPTGGDANLIAVKDVTNGGNCVATLAQLTDPAGLNGIPFGDCAALGLGSGVLVNLKGKSLANSPRWSARIGAEYYTDITTNWVIGARVDWNWRGDFWGRIFNRNPVDRIKGYSLVDGRIELARADESLYLRLQGSNLFNTRGVTGMYLGDASSGLPTNLFLQPARTVTLTVGTKF